ncbi:unnamed protein product, partial [Musa hybrid cultivar]
TASIPTHFNLSLLLLLPKLHLHMEMGCKERKTMTKKKTTPERAAWLSQLLGSEFFGACEEHKEMRKCEINTYCVDCQGCLCPHCLAPHRAHRLLQIRRYVYQDVVRILDMQRLLDCSKVQPYTVNSAKVVLLNPRKQSKPSKPNLGVPVCEVCRRSIADPNRYCSIACKTSGSWQSEDALVAVAVADAESSESESFLPHLTSDVGSSSSSSPPGSLGAGKDWNPDSPPRSRRTRPRKGIPRRAPLF